MSTLNSFFIATGSNLGDRAQNLFEAKVLLQQHFELIAESRIYESPAVDYLNQPDFYNQVLEFTLPLENPETIMSLLLHLEKEMGRNRLIPKGPRLIDLDILFWGLLKIQSETLQIPHPRLFARSFVVLPLSELPGFKILEKNFIFKFHFDNEAIALS
ncbi:MAG: 2-amino-4-hydroxy-6-hydroxymethyldihydropteridine diphosphokinase [Bacteriovorax sp.]|nr:2-amino-4-hydroxy-6-hydroxymethyldihydropteridine diphosphokinase [Bacteriovorax sp.]